MDFAAAKKLRGIALIAALLGIAAFSYWFAFRNQEPLSGELSHDFGTVQLESGKPTELKHSFELINVTDDLVRIIAARPDCGCVNARGGGALPANIMPGKTFELPITMSLQQTSKVKEVIIYLELGDGREQKLHVKAHGVPAPGSPQESAPPEPPGTQRQSTPADR